MGTSELTTSTNSKNGGAFADLETFCVFIGYPRSGHSLIGSLLDAHPNIVIAYKRDALKDMEKGFKAERIQNRLLENSQASAQAGRVSRERINGLLTGKTLYSFAVHNQWQGKFQKLRVIGYNRGGTTTQRLRSNPQLLESFKRTFDLKTKFVHVVRNPYDNISTISYRKGLSLADSINFYFSLCETVKSVTEQLASSDLFELRHETFVDRPQVKLKELCHFLGQDAPQDYLDDCAVIVHKSPHQSRHDASWDQDSIGLVKKRIAEFSFLQGYSFQN